MVVEIGVEPEAYLRAPTLGVIASARVVPGQVVQAQDVLFEDRRPGASSGVGRSVGRRREHLLGSATRRRRRFGAVARLFVFRGFSHARQQHALVLVQFVVGTLFVHPEHRTSGLM